MASRTVSFLLLLPLLGVGQESQKGLDFNCPCPAGQRRSEFCKQCREVRCQIGGMAFQTWLKDEKWASKAGHLWQENCKALASENPDIGTETICRTTASPCVPACGGQPANCTTICTQNLDRASHSCDSFPWPVPFKDETLFSTDLPDVFT
eukprot:TRINITY_DN4848_c0_g1_i1.p1 TRINITY_DN4848_c0_g1~~TRINITY_DN4848_c0_g1_i1.p1  ORF type:complete len:167 (-),score=20.43 TRINITY_DN4848_c0_g1_i1:70-522(-)